MVVRKVILASATLFQKRQRSLSNAPMLSGLLGLLKQLLDSFFPLSTQYKGKPSRREASVQAPSNRVQADPQAVSWVLGFEEE